MTSTAQTAAPASLHRVLDSWAHRRPTSLAVVSPDGTRDYVGLAADGSLIARRLRRAGVTSSDRVAVLARNGLPYLQVLYGASAAGVATVTLNWRLASDEIGLMLDDCRPRVIFCDREFLPLVADAGPVVTLDDTGLERWWSDGADDVTDVDGVASEDLDATTVIMYTTGTTGRPKGVRLTQSNLWFMAEQASAAWAMHQKMRFLACLPFFHISGLSAAISSIFCGATVVITDSMAPEDLYRTIESEMVTHTVLVPTVLNDLADNLDHAPQLDHLEVVIYGSAPAGSTLIETCMALLPNAGFSQGYGLTETAAGVTAAPLRRHGDPDDHPGSVGRPLPRVACRIVDPETGCDLPVGTVGEVWVNTPTRTPGYLHQPEATRAAITSEGWLRTGDLGEVDADGFLYIRDRLKDMIISGGENIYSIEVETAVCAHPAVREAAIVASPDPRWGETVKAVVTLRPGGTVTLEELRSWLDGRLARYKHPRVLEVVDSLPTTGSGKVRKSELRQPT